LPIREYNWIWELGRCASTAGSRSTDRSLLTAMTKVRLSLCRLFQKFDQSLPQRSFHHGPVFKGDTGMNHNFNDIRPQASHYGLSAHYVKPVQNIQEMLQHRRIIPATPDRSMKIVSILAAPTWVKTTILPPLMPIRARDNLTSGINLM
jgi:hypothetical protein